MLRISLIASAACLAVTACGVTLSKDDDAAATCTAMLAGDPEIEEDLAEDGDTVDVYCSCYETVLTDETEADQATILKVTQIIADIRSDKKLGLEPAAEHLHKDFDSDGNSAAYGVSKAEFDTTGKYVDTVRRALSDETSACQTAS